MKEYFNKLFTKEIVDDENVKRKGLNENILSKYLELLDKRLVITVAPQYDICPQGKTYPINAAAIDIKRIIIPIPHTLLFTKGEEKNKERQERKKER